MDEVYEFELTEAQAELHRATLENFVFLFFGKNRVKIFRSKTALQYSTVEQKIINFHRLG